MVRATPAHDSEGGSVRSVLLATTHGLADGRVAIDCDLHGNTHDEQLIQRKQQWRDFGNRLSISDVPWVSDYALCRRIP